MLEKIENINTDKKYAFMMTARTEDGEIVTSPFGITEGYEIQNWLIRHNYVYNPVYKWWGNPGKTCFLMISEYNL